MKKSKTLRNISMILSFIFIFGSFVYADSDKVVTLGKNLDDAQRKQILEIFKVNEKDVKIIEVNNQEERKYLEGVATEAQLGKITMSSAYVELLEEGSGIEVETYNISWVTKEMYANALVTAGVKNAKIITAAPFPVSGTGALTGVMKAFEQATGEKISEEQKKVANEEVVRVGELGEEVGKDKAAELVKKVKEEVIEKNVKDPEEIKKIIIEIAGNLNINLNTDQIQKIGGLMEKITNLDLNTQTIKDQLKDIGNKLDDTIKNNEEVKSLLQRILDAIKNFFNSIFK
ncbi:DUF1002 domain-containing protein [Tissierella creatinophila]|uniref:DUF1002 domain-containing protein n=1 Tax=Tissierella creatinophila DSM 6911 TaxID=1123403 RepID=A0A1U7M9D2_TISCR|nr:DUF1002 domain-containing protein [Tissierella creatinophila]OLS03819.1 hypothetical protein TICRE_01420 [Tissierella creatinophila DSM 6911]